MQTVIKAADIAKQVPNVITCSFYDLNVATKFDRQFEIKCIHFEVRVVFEIMFPLISWPGYFKVIYDPINLIQVEELISTRREWVDKIIL